MRIIFVHGWGLSPSFWDALSSRLGDHECGFVDLGFSGDPEDASAAGEGVYVTHSLGTLWTLKNRSEKIKGLIAINGFASFRRFASKEALMKTRESVCKDPEAHMADFFQSVEIDFFRNLLNAGQLLRGLDWLSEWDGRTELKALECPVLSLAGAQDLVLPLAQMKKEWAGNDMKICEGGGHGLPQTHTEWCAQHIQDLLS